MIKELYLVDYNTELISAWEEAFSPFNSVEIIEGDFFSKTADLMVSPANSFGIMDGGLDLAIRNKLGVDVETRLRNEIVTKHHGELVVGQAHIIETKHSMWPYMVAAPTMRVPMTIDGTLNVYYAFRAILQMVELQNKKGAEINSILCPGLGTGIGGLPAYKAAGQMAFAYKQYQELALKPTARQVLNNHAELVKFI